MAIHPPSHETGALVSHIPFSSNQEFTYLFEEGDADGQFGPRNHLVHGWRLTGKVDVGLLRAALYDLVVRHEMLRTSIVIDQHARYQEVWPPTAPRLAVRDLPCSLSSRDRRAEEFLIEVESTALDIREQPHIRAILGRFDANDSVLVIQAHHTVTDGWSMRLIMRDLAALYAAHEGYAPLPSASQYREYAAWQQDNASEQTGNVSRKYWREKLRDAQVFVLRTDLPQTSPVRKLTSVHRHLITEEVMTAVRRLARDVKGTPFMVLLSAFELLINQLTGETDIVVPTFTPGRDNMRFEHTVGPFFNFLPLRTDIDKCKTFIEVLHRTRITCIESYANDIPFMQILAEAPQIMDSVADENSAPCVFQIFPFPFVLDGELIGDLHIKEIRRRLLSQPVGSDIPDGVLWTLNMHPDGDLIGHLQFRRNRFFESTISRIEGEFYRLLRNAVSAPDSPLVLHGS
jgi:condensation enzyme